EGKMCVFGVTENTLLGCFFLFFIGDSRADRFITSRHGQKSNAILHPDVFCLYQFAMFCLWRPKRVCQVFVCTKGVKEREKGSVQKKLLAVGKVLAVSANGCMLAICGLSVCLCTWYGLETS